MTDYFCPKCHSCIQEHVQTTLTDLKKFEIVLHATTLNLSQIKSLSLQ